MTRSQLYETIQTIVGAEVYAMWQAMKYPRMHLPQMLRETALHLFKIGADIHTLEANIVREQLNYLDTYDTFHFEDE